VSARDDLAVGSAPLPGVGLAVAPPRPQPDRSPSRAASQAGAPTGVQWAARFPPRPVASSWPVTQAPRTQVVTRLLAAPFALAHPLSQQTRRQGLLTVISWLQSQPGDTWQQRWLGSGAEAVPDWRDLVTARTGGRAAGAGPAPGARPPHLSPGLLVLICGDVIRPSLAWLAAFAPARRGLADELARTRDGAAFARLSAMCRQAGIATQTGQTALTRIGMIMAVKGGTAADITVGDCLQLLRGHRPDRGQAARRGGQPAVLPAAARAGRPRAGRAGNPAGVHRHRATVLRPADRPLPDRLPPGA